MAASLIAVVAGACGGNPGGGGPKRGSADGGSIRDAPASADADGPAGDRAPEAGCADAGSAKMMAGQPCGCQADCANNLTCVDGVCCSTACNEGCKSCALPGMEGTCASIPAGGKPRDAQACPTGAASTCGLDGTCDGVGACRKYQAGTQCQAGTCDGDSVVGAYACDGTGRCRPGPTVICVPFSCNPATGRCYDTCTISSQCTTGQQCVATSCGKKMKGASCTANADCASGFCADGVCCNVACQGPCVSCALTGREGTCWAIDASSPDPRGVCRDQGTTSCGTTGACDGLGGCAKYPAETMCVPPSCSGNRLNTAGTCDGLGTCRPPGVQACTPFACVGGSCNSRCTTNADCDVGRACVNGTCGPKLPGQSCAAAGECLSGFCVDGVCCESACTGACRSCALASAPGKCSITPVGNSDPRGVCTDTGVASCGTNGRCDGSGACQKYAVGSVCAPETCTSNVFTAASTCSATGRCTAPDSLPCSPYVCNGSRCFTVCTTNSQCLTPNVCNVNSCGKKLNGASCSTATECQSGFCAQGVCCNAACTASCKSCALSGTMGACTNVTAGSADPAGACVTQAPTTCGTNGKCDGAGACQKFAKGTACKDASCPAQTATFTPGSTCDGAGTCVTPASSSCSPYRCGTNVCKSTCTADADCLPPAVCTGGSCGLKALGRTCAAGNECVSGFCAQGVCCNSACTGTCQSCALSASAGTCSNVAAGAADPKGTCVATAQSTCGTDGFCNGSGGCRLYAAGTQCVAPSCPAGMATLTNARTCDGAGTCRAATTSPCAPFACNGTTACNAACTTDNQCLSPNICDSKTNLCGNKKRLGQACTATADCLTGNFCVDGVCCGTSSCGTCQACNVSGSAGTCTSVALGGAEPHGGCTPSPPCGNTGACNGAGGCQQAGAGVSCGNQTCMGSTLTPVSHCTGTGTCAQPTPASCSPFVCGTNNACKTTCTADTDCVSPFTCQGSGTSKACALKANGLACTAGSQCITGNCIDGVCCGSSGCDFCQACNINGLGTCAPKLAGAMAPPGRCPDQGAPSCGTNGKCDGAGGCQKYIDGTVCSNASCSTTTNILTATGMCSGGVCSAPQSSCSPYFCNGATGCNNTCSSDTSCVAGFFCNGNGGMCVQKRSNGATCTRDGECGTAAVAGHCVDGVCCTTAACPACQACNLSGNGTCAPVGAGTPAPPSFCTDQGPASCGTNGRCDGSGSCQLYGTSTLCQDPSCPAGTSTATSARFCDGAGSCAPGTTTDCGAFLCDGNSSCLAMCGDDTACLFPNVCDLVTNVCGPLI